MSQRLTPASSILASGVPLPKNSVAPRAAKEPAVLFDIHHKSEVHTFSLLTAYLFHLLATMRVCLRSMPQRSVLRRVVLLARLHQPLKAGLIPSERGTR